MGKGPQAPHWSEPAVVSALRDKFPSPAYAVLYHVRSHTGYGGQERTIDAVIMGLWPSRGVELWGIEIKSDRRDWLREMKDPAKADRLFRFFDRFFLVTGHEDVARLDEIPGPWGWMVLNAKQHFVTRKAAPLNEAAEPPSRRFLASLMRNVTERIDATQRQRAFEAGYQKGRKAVVDVSHFERAERSYNELRQKVRQFEDASGLSIQYAMDIPKLGEVARVLMNGAGFWRLRSAMTSAATDAEAVAAVLKRALAQLPSDDVLKREATA